MSKNRETYVYELEEWEEEVERVLRLYVAEAWDSAHRAEDRLKEHYIRDRGAEGDARAMAIIRLLDQDRRRWFS